jgi:hypothetical protein
MSPTSHGPFGPFRRKSLRSPRPVADNFRVTDPLVVRRRPVAIALAALPAVVVAVLLEVVRELPPLHVLVPVTAAVGGCAWVLWRLLSSRVTVLDDGLVVRGVTEDTEIPWSALTDVSIDRAPWWARMLMWGVMDPYAVTLRLTGGARVQPVALWSSAEDSYVVDAVSLMRTRVAFPVARAFRRTQSV